MSVTKYEYFNEDLARKILVQMMEDGQPRIKDYNVGSMVWDNTSSYLKDHGLIQDITISRNTNYLYATLTNLGEAKAKSLE
ncbi:hypothetical protein [Halobacillus naozhouensis]|uniref:YjcQ protein n=1 Tax=Halobacillus naozhouensis TaxID=554880 RepID=A0ABY8IV38_9BACI|nr:hypothetical protein [Halobacillus naozhouensis]WFT73058.1 hypothetical protein P9989_11620 [Halobacillus naozhouensis]